jgi:hypothetical protein
MSIEEIKQLLGEIETELTVQRGLGVDSLDRGHGRLSKTIRLGCSEPASSLRIDHTRECKGNEERTATPRPTMDAGR